METPFNLGKIKEQRNFKETLPSFKTVKIYNKDKSTKENPSEKIEREKLQTYLKDIDEVVISLIKDHEKDIDLTCEKLSLYIENFKREDFESSFKKSVQVLLRQMFLSGKTEYSKQELKDIIFAQYFDFLNSIIKMTKIKKNQVTGLNLSKADAIQISKKSGLFTPKLYESILNEEGMTLSRSNLVYLLNKTSSFSEIEFRDFVKNLNTKIKNVSGALEKQKIQINTLKIKELITRNSSLTEEEIITKLSQRYDAFLELEQELKAYHPDLFNFFPVSTLQTLAFKNRTLVVENIIKDLEVILETSRKIHSEIPKMNIPFIAKSLVSKVPRNENGVLSYDVPDLVNRFKSRLNIVDNLNMYFKNQIPHYYLEVTVFLKLSKSEEELRAFLSDRVNLINEIGSLYKDNLYIAKTGLQEYVFRHPGADKKSVIQRINKITPIAEGAYQKFKIKEIALQKIIFTKLILLPNVSPEIVVEKCVVYFLHKNEKHYTYIENWKLHNHSEKKSLEMSDILSALVEAGSKESSVVTAKKILQNIESGNASEGDYKTLAGLILSNEKAFKLLQEYIATNKEVDTYIAE